MSVPTKDHAGNRQALLVLGMHRSGTSALSGFLVRLGARAPRTLMPARPDNPRGHFESDAFFEFNERLLHAAGTSWDSWRRLDPEWFDRPIARPFEAEFRRLLAEEFGDAHLFVIKDPRISRFAAFWIRQLRAERVEPAIVFSVRNPLDVARSLTDRDGFSTERGLLIWLRHVLDAEAATRTVCRAFVRYEDLLKDWKAVAEILSRDLQIDWPAPWPEIEQEMAAFLTPDLRHHAIALTSLQGPEPLSTWVKETCRAFDLLLEKNGRGADDAFQMLDAIRQEFDRVSTVFGGVLPDEKLRLRGRVLALEQELIALGSERDDLRRHAANLEEERADLRRHATNLETERADLRRHAANLEAERADLRQHATNLETERADLRKHAANLAAERDDLRWHASNLATELDGVRQHAANLESERDALKQHIANVESGRENDRVSMQQHANNLVAERDSLREHAANLERELASLRDHVAKLRIGP